LAHDPVTVITGFLGAGKTTLLNRLLRDPAFADTAVLVNELGEIGIDNLLVERVDDTVALLSSGCVCCSIRGELADALAGLARRRDEGAIPPFRRAVIETTGLADPAPVLQTLIAHERQGGRFRLDGVVTLVDAVNGEATLDTYVESVRQVAMADRLALAKLDLVDAAAAARLAERLHGINPGAAVADARSLAPGDLASIAGSAPSPDALLRWLAAGRHDHAVAHHSDIRTFALTHDAPLAPARLEAFLDLLRQHHGEKLLRMKAIVSLSDDPDRPVVLHGVQHVLHPVMRLDRWPGTGRASRLVFIVRGIEPRAIEDLFAAFTGTPGIDRPDAAALTESPLTLSRGA
jgi:G3E family GTPase